MHLSTAIPGGGGVTPETYGGMARDLLAFVANVWPGTGALDRFCTSEGRYTHGERHAGFVISPPDPDSGNGFQNGDREIKKL